MTKPLNECSREELIEIIGSLKRQKKFGLVWEDKPEKVAEECKTKLPVLEEIEEKKIQLGGDEPTNLIIEGDNYHALSVLNYTHAGKIDVIYIDPPYNTGNKDFVYNDQFIDKEDAFSHSKWLSFMDKRLRLAKNLLSDDGVIFISIDDNECSHLKILCDSIFGENNLIATMPRKTTEHMRVNATYEMQNLNDYILFYANNKNKTVLTKKNDGAFSFPYSDANGAYMLKAFQNSGANGTRAARPNLYYPIFYDESSKTFSLERKSEKDIEILPKKVKKEDGRWLWSKEKFQKDNNLLEYKNDTMFRKAYFDESQDNTKYVAYKTWLDTFPNRLGAASLKKLGLDELFDYSKPPELIKFLVNLSVHKNSILLDFFAGSGTTGQAVLELNKEDGGHRQFILCTNNENSIAEEVTYPRIKTVVTGTRIDGSKYSDGVPANLRYFKTDFVEKERSTDATREKLVERSADMIRIRENAFEEVKSESINKYYQSKDAFVAVIFDPFEIKSAWAEIEKLNAEEKLVKLYIFSYSRDTSAFTEEIPKTTLKWEAVPIPESILQVYKRLFGGKK